MGGTAKAVPFPKAIYEIASYFKGGMVGGESWRYGLALILGLDRIPSLTGSRVPHRLALVIPEHKGVRALDHHAREDNVLCVLSDL